MHHVMDGTYGILTFPPRGPLSADGQRVRLRIKVRMYRSITYTCRSKEAVEFRNVLHVWCVRCVRIMDSR